MATSQAAPATTVAAGGGGTASTTSGTTTVEHAGWHVFRIDCFSATKDLGVGKSIKSATFRVGGHDWYIECYPCGYNKQVDPWVHLFLRRQDDHPAAYTVSVDCEFTLMESLKDGCFKELVGHPSEWARDGLSCTFSTSYFIKREKLESLLKDDCFQVRCIVFMDKFPAGPQQDLATETLSGSHVLTVEGYTKTRGALAAGQCIDSMLSRVGGHKWCIRFYPCGEDENDTDGVTTYLCLKDKADDGDGDGTVDGDGDDDDDDDDDEDEDEDEDKDSDANDDEVKLRFEMTLLTLAGQKISSIQDFYTFSDQNKKYLCKFLSRMEHESSSLLQDGIQIRCDMAVVKGIREVQPPPNLGTDVTFEVGGALFSAHKCVLTTRCTAFMAEFSRPAGKENAGVTQVLRIDDMEPRVFKALLHFIYTDTVPEIHEEDMVEMAQGLLVAADRYAMERLKLICADMLCGYVDATTAVTMRELADKHGCLKLKEACVKVIREWLAKVTP